MKAVRIAPFLALALVLALAVGSALAAVSPPSVGAGKPTSCPADQQQLTGCIKSVQPTVSKLVIDCNGLRHNVMLSKGAKITLNKQTSTLSRIAKVKTGNTKITAYGRCGHGNQFLATRLAIWTTPAQRPIFASARPMKTARAY